MSALIGLPWPRHRHEPEEAEEPSRASSGRDSSRAGPRPSFLPATPFAVGAGENDYLVYDIESELRRFVKSAAAVTILTNGSHDCVVK